MMISSKSYVEALKHIASLPTIYKNQYPYNLGYNDGKVYSFDCWNLIKTVINRMCLNNGVWYDSKVGEYQKNLSVTGDISGSALLNKCTTKSTDFTKIGKNGTYLYMSGHSGTFIDWFEKDGKYYNVVECTGAWSHGVLYSWVDNDGTRRKYKGGAISGKWTNWGLLPWVDYTYSASDSLPVENIVPENVTSYTIQKGDTLGKIAKKYKVTVKQLCEWNNIKDKNLIIAGKELKIYG